MSEAADISTKDLEAAGFVCHRALSGTPGVSVKVNENAFALSGDKS